MEGKIKWTKNENWPVSIWKVTDAHELTVKVLSGVRVPDARESQ